MLVGREGKLEAMEKIWASDGMHFAAVYGSHRSGKTSFLAEFTKDKKGVFFSAQKLNPFMNLRLFEKAVAKYTGEEENFPAWKNAFLRIANLAAEERFLLVIDDFSELVFSEKSILKDFRSAMESNWKNTKLFVAVGCGRVSFTENEIIGESSSAFAKRPTVYKLDELDYFEAAKLLPEGLAPEDKLRFYCCLGGIPEYLKMVNGKYGFEENIRRIYLRSGSPLAELPPMVYLDELREPEFYNSILFAIAGGKRRINEIVAETGESSTKVNKYLLTMLQMHIIDRNIPFGEEDKISRKGIYSISSKALAFWFRFVLPNATEIKSGKEPLKKLTEKIDVYIMEGLFAEVCSQYMNRKNKQGEMPFICSVISGYWNSLREYSSGKLVAANQRGRQILFAEYARKFDEPAESIIRRFREGDKLFPEYWERYDMLFSFEPLPRELRNMENMKFKLVDTEALYK